MTPQSTPGWEPDGSPMVAGSRTAAGPQIEDQAPRAPIRFWHRRVWAVCFTIFALEIGLFLVVFPWMDSWDINHFQRWFPRLQDFWEDPYLRGAVSGLGLVNVYIACGEVIRLIRGPRAGHARPLP
jgi:hypothetical protein